MAKPKLTPSTNRKKLVVKKTAGKKLSFTQDPNGPSSPTVVAIGASAGGLEAMTLFLKNLSPTTGMAFIYVQHLSPDHKSLLTSILSKITDMTVQEIDDMEKIKPDNVYIIPHNKDIKVTDGHIKLIPRPKSKASNLSIDVLFSSLAVARKENVIGVVLSGSANDGTRGLKEIKEAGGITFAQDDSAKFTSMPHSAIAEGVVDFILSPKEIAVQLNWMSKHPLVNRQATKPAPEDEIENSDPDLKNILQVLLKNKNVDFSNYKMNTIKRRMLRRMLIHKMKTLKQYAAFLLKEKDEVDLLHQDLLINVTDFFRDTDAFQYLKKTVLPRLLKSKSPNETLRIWVAGCSTGEEVYSIAMMLRELQGDKTQHVPFQIFASDLSASAISEARNGEYSLQRLKNVSPKRLQQFFTKSNDKYRISKSLRDICVFATHNILRDPPFSRMDFITCRNLLIYLDNAAQKKAISTFHYALNDDGCLMLGKSETIGTFEDLFTAVNKKFKIYSRKKNSGAHRITDKFRSVPLPSQERKTSLAVENIPFQKKLASTPGNLGAEFDAALLANHLPASVLINHDLDIIQFRGSTEIYLKHTSGKASFNILRMARPEITFELRNAIHHAIKTKQPVSKTGIEMNPEKHGTAIRVVNLEVAPFKIEGEEPMLMVVFTGQTMELLHQPSSGAKNNSIAKDRRIKKLEEELAAARSAMNSITHDQEAANEELQSANEEIVSTNEELQSLNEELETSKEEIESTNEELSTTNHELLARNQQVEELYTYYESILSTIQEPLLILDKQMRIKSANKSFHKTFHVSEEETVGVSLFKLGNNQWNIPALRELLDDIVPKNIRFHNFEVDHIFPVIGHKVMLLNAHRIIKQSHNEELIVLTIHDITEAKKAATELKEEENQILAVKLESDKKAFKLFEDSIKRYSMILMQSPFAFAILKGKTMVIDLANKSVKELWGKGKQIEGKPIFEVLPEIKDGPIPALLDEVYTSGIPFQGYEMLVPLLRKGKLDNVYFNFVYQPYYEADKTISGVTVIAYEVTEHMLAKNQLVEAKLHAEEKTRIAEEATKSKQQFLSNMSHEIRTPMNAIIGFTSLIMKTELSAKQKEYLSAIKISGDALIVLINDILDLAKVDAGKMTFEKKPFKMRVSITSMLHLFDSKIKENNTALETEYDNAIPEVLLGDAKRLHQIILNLLSNAVKFTSGGKISVDVRLLNEDDEKVTIEFSVADTGIGIPENKIDKIFENFQQVHTDTTKMYGGTGLGLAIVKQLVEAQGGSITVKSKMGLGTTFCFIMSFLKTKESVEEELEKIEFFDAELERIKVLVVEDNALNQLLIRTLLNDFGFDHGFASNGKIAIEKLKTESYDIVLMDLQMPEMNGFEATEYIRKIMNSEIPIIALSADVTTIDVTKCKAAGMNDYIAKPVDEKLLYRKIIDLVKKPISTRQEKVAATQHEIVHGITKKEKYLDLTFLVNRTKSNPKLMMEIISLYLKQTPPLLDAMRQGMKDKDWKALYSAVHKLIPSFSIMGIQSDGENMAKKIQEYASLDENIREGRAQQEANEIQEMIFQLDTICVQTCQELREEFEKLENVNHLHD